MLTVKIDPDALSFVGEDGRPRLRVVFHRTLRIPDDGKEYPLPPSLGAFPLKRVLDYKERVPTKWLGHGGVFLPMYQREAMWLAFERRNSAPCALKVAAGKINAVSGEEWDQALLPPEEREEGLQDYLVVPPQPWLDGFNTGEGTIKQFIAMPLGMGYTVEGQVTGEEKHGGIQLIVYEAKEGRFLDDPFAGPTRGFGGGTAPGGLLLNDSPSEQVDFFMADPFGAPAGGDPFGAPGGGDPFGAPGGGDPFGAVGGDPFGPPSGDECFEDLGGADPFAAPSAPVPAAGREMGLGGGGTMTQKIYEDPHGHDAWDPDEFGRVFVHIVNSTMYREITGEDPPPSPISAQTYTDHGYPWFAIYDEGQADVGPSSTLQKVKSVGEMDQLHGFTGLQDDSSVQVPPKQIKDLPRDVVPDGDW